MLVAHLVHTTIVHGHMSCEISHKNFHSIYALFKYNKISYNDDKNKIYELVGKMIQNLSNSMNPLDMCEEDNGQNFTLKGVVYM